MLMSSLVLPNHTNWKGWDPYEKEEKLDDIYKIVIQDIYQDL